MYSQYNSVHKAWVSNWAQIQDRSRSKRTPEIIWLCHQRNVNYMLSSDILYCLGWEVTAVFKTKKLKGFFPSKWINLAACVRNHFASHKSKCTKQTENTNISKDSNINQGNWLWDLLDVHLCSLLSIYSETKCFYVYLWLATMI